MSLNSYLTRVASAAIIRDTERDSIRRSVDAIQARIGQHFGDDIKEQRIFGSFERKTMLPRPLDAESDVDLLIIFKDGGYRPQTYIERLLRFAHERYVRSEIARSHPTVALRLSHVRFELVPALHDLWNGLRIPAPRKNWSEWIETDPEKLSNDLREKHKGHDQQIRPLVRVLKYWNVLNHRPFASFELEQRVIKTGYVSYGAYYLLGERPDLFTYFARFAGSLRTTSFQSHSLLDQKIKKLRTEVSYIQKLASAGDILSAENRLQRLLPLPT